MPEREPLKVFEPDNPQEAVQGWALHATPTGPLTWAGSGHAEAGARRWARSHFTRRRSAA
jgi:hypothetical protein